MWAILLCETSRGKKPVEEFIKKQNQRVQAKILQLLTLLEIHGPQLGMPHTKKLRSDIYELRIRGKNELRILYFFHKNRIYLVHAFKKKSNKTPLNEIEIAINRIQSITSSLYII